MAEARATGSRSRRSRPIFLVASMLLAALCLLATACGASATATPLSDIGATINHPVPTDIQQVPLVDQHGQAVDLSAWHGKTVLVVPFLTLCTDVCPLTTGVMYQVERTLQHDGVASKVVLVELSVDPGRDTPYRLAAYAKMTGATWQLVTETPASLAEIAKFFGFSYEKVPEGSPPSIDWLTGKPLTYDIDHSDGFVIIDAKGTERFVNGASPNFKGGKLAPKLEKFLSPLGHRHQDHPPDPNYTAPDVVRALGSVMHQNLSTDS